MIHNDGSRVTTGEYVTRWRTIVEDHLFSELAKSLRRLARIEPGDGGPGSQQVAVLAYHLAHALRVAASQTGGVQASVEYLQWAAAASPSVDPAEHCKQGVGKGSPTR